MRIATSSFIALLAILFFTAQIQFVGSKTLESAAPPDDTKQTWVQSSTKWMYHYDSTLNKWVGPPQVLVFGHGNANFTGSLKTAAGNVTSDSTAATEHGYALGQQGVITRVTTHDAVGSGTVDALAMLLATGQDTLYFQVWPTDAQGNVRDSTGMALEVTATDILTGYSTAGVTSPDQPKMFVYFSPTVDPS